MVSLSRRLETLLLVQEFLVHEAELLDRRRFRAWLDLLADDLTYKAPVRQTVYPPPRRPDAPPEQGALGDIEAEFDDLAHGMHYFDETKESLTVRVAKLETNTAWAEVPPSRTRRLVTNVRVQQDDGGELDVASYFYVYKSRLEATEDVYIGERRDRLRRHGDSFQLASRVIYLDQTVLLVKNISVFL